MIPGFGPRTAAVLALAAGLLAALAHPPFGFLPGLLGYAVMLCLADRAPGPRPLRAAFWRGWLAGFAYFLVGCWWVAEAFMVDARGQGWMAPFAVVLLPAGLGLFWGAALALYRAMRPAGPWRVLGFAGALTAMEWVRGHLLTGFPWNLPGESWAAGSAVSQAAATFGAYGLTWLTLVIASSFAVPFSATGGPERRRALVPVVLALALLGLLWGHGALRLRHAVADDPSAPFVRVVQADVKQQAKYDQDNLRAIFARYLTLTAQPAARTPDIVVWSEGAVPISANELLSPLGGAPAIRAALQPGQSLLFGAYRAETGAERTLYYNSLVAVRATPEGLQATGVYDKHRLVPFGEFLPAEEILGPLGVKNLAHLADSFASGRPPAPIAPEGVPAVQPLICYEALFPGLVRHAVGRGPTRPRWIVNVSNDAWFGVTSGPLQHLNMASYRSIEQGLPMVRATPTGVSAVIDAYGRSGPSARLGFGRMGVIDAALPPALPATIYGRWGDATLLAFLVLSLAPFLPGILHSVRSLAVTLPRLCLKHWARLPGTARRKQR